MDELFMAADRTVHATKTAAGFQSQAPKPLNSQNPYATSNIGAGKANLSEDIFLASPQYANVHYSKIPGDYEVANDPFMTHSQSAPKATSPVETQLADTRPKVGLPPIPPKPPAPNEPPLIPYWYRSESNFSACREKMAQDYADVCEAFTGQWSDEQRALGETRGERAKDFMYNRTGGRLGNQYRTRTRSAHVVDIFQDEWFPPNEASWNKPDEISDYLLPTPSSWIHLFEYTQDAPYPRSSLASGIMSPRPGRVYQGVIEDFYIVQALQALSMKPQLVAEVFSNMEFSNPSLGVFTVRMFKHAQWMSVMVDDTIPVDGMYQPMCCSSEFYPEWNWPSIIEKAYAKLHGSWEGLAGGGHVEEVLADLTGGVASRFDTHDVAIDRFFQYLQHMLPFCVFGCKINSKECGKRNVPIEDRCAGAIYEVTRIEGEPYVNVCVNAPTASVRHLPVCQVPSISGYGIAEGFSWLRLEDFVELFDTIYECRLVNSPLQPPGWGMVPRTPGWMNNGMPWFEQIWAYQGDVVADTAPSFFIDVVHPEPVEIIMEASQTDCRYGQQNTEKGEDVSRGVHAPILIRFYQCGPEVDEFSGGEIYGVHMSAWGHCRDAMCCVKVMRPGRYLARVTMPMRYHSQRMLWRTYSSHPLNMRVLVDHFSFTELIPDKPLNAIPFSLVGMPKVDTETERLPMMFDDEEGKGIPTTAQWGLVRMFQEMVYQWQLGNMREERRHQMNMDVVGKFGGRGAVATVDAAETQEVKCSIM